MQEPTLLKNVEPFVQKMECVSRDIGLFTGSRTIGFLPLHTDQEPLAGHRPSIT
jgi:hypothetical protein